MGAVLGGRTSRDLVRTGADRAFVSAEFSQVPGDLAGLAETGAAPDEDGHLLLQREPTGTARTSAGSTAALSPWPSCAGSEKSC